MNEELKPCPFCGGEAKVIQTFVGMYCVGCKQCKAWISFVGGEEREQAIEMYNRRANDED